MRVKTHIRLIEILVAFAVILICARFIWTKELIAIENHAFISLGLPIYSKYILTIPLAALFIYDRYRRESIKAKSKGIPVISKPVALTALALLSVAVLLLSFAVISNA